MLSALSASHKLQFGSTKIRSISSACLIAATPDVAHQDELKQIGIGRPCNWPFVVWKYCTYL